MTTMGYSVNRWLYKLCSNCSRFSQCSRCMYQSSKGCKINKSAVHNHACTLYFPDWLNRYILSKTEYKVCKCIEKSLQDL